MARPTSRHSRPGRTLLVLLALIIALGGTMFLQKAFTPKLGLDLAGGTTVTLSPVTQNGAAPPEEILDRAVNIIRDRVNGNGITDAEVIKSGDNIIISVPGAGQKEVLELVGTTAELRFRQVLAIAATQTPQELATEAPKPGTTPSAAPSSTESSAPTQSGKPSPSQSAGAPKPSTSPTGKALSSALVAPSATPSAAASQKADETPKAKETPKAQQTKDGKATPTSAPTPSGQPTQDPSTAINTQGIDKDVLAQFNKLDCTDPKNRGKGVQDDPAKQFAACESDGSLKYVLDVAKVVGTDISSASAGVQQGTTQWLVQLDFKSQGASAWSKLTSTAYSSQAPRNQVAVVLDGVVITAPNIIGPIPGGRAEITGGFTQQSATEPGRPAQVRRAAAEVQPQLDRDRVLDPRPGPAHGRPDLRRLRSGPRAPLLLAYYRGLGIVAVLSLVVATILTYTTVVVLGHNAGFRLSLPHIIGLVVSIGITADSFIVYFERIRDEMKEGRRTLRAAVEVAWVRARRTILIADAVMFIAAVVLYVLAVAVWPGSRSRWA